MSAEQFVSRACRLLEVDVERLRSLARDSATAELRRLVTTLGVERWGQRGAEIAVVLGKNPDVVSWWVGQGVRRRLQDADFARRNDRLDQEMASVHTASNAPDARP